MYLWPSAVPAFLFCLAVKTLSRVSPCRPPLLRSSHFLSSLSPVLSFQISTLLSFSLAVKTCRGQLLRDKGKDMDGFPGSTASQAGSEAGGQPQCSCGEQRLISSAAFLLWTKSTGGVYNTGRQCYFRSSLPSLLLCFLLTFTLLLCASSSLLSTSRPQPSICKQISAHVIRCLHHSSAFTAHFFLLPPSLPSPPPLAACLPCLYLSALWVFPSTPPPPSFAAACYYWSSCRADGRQADVESDVGRGCDMRVRRQFDWLHAIC